MRYAALIAIPIAVLAICVIKLRAEPKEFFKANNAIPRDELFRKGTEFIRKDMPDSALAYLTLASQGYNRPGLSEEELKVCARSLGNAGYVHFFCFNDYPAAYSSLILSNEIAERLSMTRLSCNNDINIGNIYSINRDFKEASVMYKKAYRLARSNGYGDLMMMAFLDLADIYFNEMGEIEPMRDEIEEFRLDSIPPDNQLAPYTRNLYRALKCVSAHIPGAIGWLVKAKDSIGDTHRGERYIYNADFMISRILQNEGKPRQAVSWLKPILSDSAIKNNRDVEAMAYQRISEYYDQAGMADSAKHFRIRFLEHSDSVFSTRKMTAVRDLRSSHERQMFVSEINRMTDTQEFQKKLLIYICVALSVVIALLIWILFKNRQLHSRNVELYKRNKELLDIHEHVPYIDTASLSEITEPHGPEDVSDIPDTEISGEKPVSSEQNARLLPDSDFMVTLRKRILEVMESNEIFSPSFNSSRLAALCDTHTRYLSAALSSMKEGGFPALLAELRVREAMRRLSCNDPRFVNLTIEAIGESVGFRTRTTFSSTFKRVSGLTPKEFRKLSLEKA